MTLDDAKSFLGAKWLLHEDYSAESTPWHSMRVGVDVRRTWARVIARRIRERADRQMLRRVA